MLPTIDVIVTCSEDLRSYDSHLEEVLRRIAQISQVSLSKQRSKPLVIFSSGCKDYGRGGRHGDEALLPHTEESPLNRHRYWQNELLLHRRRCLNTPTSLTV